MITKLPACLFAFSAAAISSNFGCGPRKTALSNANSSVADKVYFSKRGASAGCGTGTVGATGAINKTDLAPYVGADLKVMEADTIRMRTTAKGLKLFVMTNLKTNAGLAEVVAFIETKGMLQAV